MGLTVPVYLEVRGLDVRYAKQVALGGVDLEVQANELVAVLGPNGAGKTTLLRTLAGLTSAAAGTVRLQGRTITDISVARRVAMGMGFVPSGRAVFPGLSVADNLLASCHAFAWDRRRVEERFAYVIGLFPRLGERLGQPAGSLSGGEQQMLALAKCLTLEPRLLLIDELSLGLAPGVVAELVGVVASLKAAGTTMVVVEQSLRIARQVADRAVWLERGEVRFDGPVDGLLDDTGLLRLGAVRGSPPAT